MGGNALGISAYTKIYVPKESVDVYKVNNGWKAYANYIIGYDFDNDRVESSMPTNEIWYTSIDGKIITPNVETFSKAKIISNVYENGQGVITFDEKVTWIPSEAFQSNKELVTISISDGISGIGTSAFSGCTSLENVIFSEEVTMTYINSATFYGCISLKSINLPDSVHVINPGAFAGCTSLTSITIPQNVTGIYGGPYYDYDGAFEGCKALNTVYCKSTTPPSLPKYNTGNCWIFSNNAPERKIYVPKESVDAYKKANGWKVYAEDIVGYEF